MKSSSSASRTPLNTLYPCSSRRVLGRLETSTLKIEEVEYSAGSCLARHSQAFPFLACTVRGIHWSASNQAGYVCRPGTVRFLPAGEPHENYLPARSRCLLVKLQSPILEHASEHGPLLRVPGELATQTAAMLCRLLRAELHQNDELSGLAIETLSLELLLAGQKEPMWPRAPIPAWLRRTQEMLHEEIEGRLTLSELGRRAGRHPVQVCRQFHRRFGCTISEYVRRLRVARAQSLLTSSEFGLADIALSSGFSDQSHFTKVFRRLTGIPPWQYRKQNAQKAAPA
ncbi:MAG: AraC family transcriptional regulator [Candidatus Acidiferrum sp.]